MRKSIALFILASICVFAACKNDKTKTTSPEGYQTYSSDSLGFSMEYPEEFEPKKNIRQEVPIAFYEVNEDTSNYLFHPNLLTRIRPIPPVKISASDYLQATQTEIKLSIQSKVPDFKTYAVDSMKVDGISIGSFKYDIPINDSTIFTCKMYVALLKERAIEFNCTTNAADFTQYEQTFDKMIQSLKFSIK